MGVPMRSWCRTFRSDPRGFTECGQHLPSKRIGMRNSVFRQFGNYTYIVFAKCALLCTRCAVVTATAGMAEEESKRLVPGFVCSGGLRCDSFTE